MPSLIQSLNHLKTEDIPWSRLTTPYGKGTEIPDLIRERRFGEIGQLVEHQGTLWQVTPWTLLFMLRESAGKRLDELPENERWVYKAVWEAIRDVEESGQEIPEYPADPLELLREELLWAEDSDEEDESEWLAEEMRGYDPASFAAYYVYSRMLLEEAFSDDYGTNAKRSERSE
ncbi:hypothetical protein CDO73_10965 [Saccharibacillus sp. O23]|uniref:hypothetical protein n=1 Tax=Saccharibacillus sp. O23 TaxID=2009338 RepID=UPI000B4E0D3A|nr:hypothetical protein [Saccharibacillus sp. O23]OWR30429.1 hypothetical protein CDO73_10965 [Saccharibacillus sp. O23]